MTAKQQFLLFESSAGYALFKRDGGNEVALAEDPVQKSITEFKKFSQIVQLSSFIPFSSAEEALENLNDVSEGVLNPTLKDFLKTNVPKKNAVLGVGDPQLGSAISNEIGINCERTKSVTELLRGVRLHFHKFIKEMSEKDIEKTQLGLGHSYSRAKVKFNIHKADNMIIQSICLLDQLDKDLNTFSMRCREWYSWHFPELSKIISDHYTYARLVKVIRNKNDLSEESLPAMTEITEDEDKSKEILEASRASMGTDISEIDLINIERFADRVINLSEYRQHLHSYLMDKMHTVAPNLSALMGELIGARLISHAGSLTNLAKLPASTIQILGAEKALFRALRSRSNTPKYGLIFHSTYIGRAAQDNKGRISRYLSNKCAVASRIDCFSDTQTTVFGEKLKEQVEDRLKFYLTGEPPKKNQEAMKEALKESQATPSKKRTREDSQTPKKKKKSRVPEEAGKEVPEETPMEEVPEEVSPMEEGADAMEVEETTPKKTPKKKKTEKSEGAEGITPKKTPKKKKSEESEQVKAEETPKKTPKKKKSEESEQVEEESTTPKKTPKKKKSEESEQVEEKETPKKTPKKKKSDESEQVEEERATPKKTPKKKKSEESDGTTTPKTKTPKKKKEEKEGATETPKKKEKETEDKESTPKAKTPKKKKEGEGEEKPQTPKADTPKKKKTPKKTPKKD